MALVAGGPYELCMTTQIPAPALFMIESGHGMLPSSLWSLQMVTYALAQLQRARSPATFELDVSMDHYP